MSVFPTAEDKKGTFPDVELHNKILLCAEEPGDICSACYTGLRRSQHLASINIPISASVLKLTVQLTEAAIMLSKCCMFRSLIHEMDNGAATSNIIWCEFNCRNQKSSASAESRSHFLEE